MGKRRQRAPAPYEKAIQAAVVEHWRTLGRPRTLVAAIPNARAFGQPGLTRGLADLLVMAPELPVGFIELKRDHSSVLSDAQAEFCRLCDGLSIPYAICVGRDEPITILEAWDVIKPARAAA